MQGERVLNEYDQGTDLGLLTRLFGFIKNRSVIDVGAERGTFVRALLNAGAEAVYAFEPFPRSVEALRSAFAETPSVTIFDVALGNRDEDVTLHVVEDKTSLHEDAFHSLVPFDETPTLHHVGEIRVRCRTLASLVDEGLIPAEVGLLKIDAERSDFAVLQGMGPLSCQLVMLEYWNDLEATVGPAAYEVDDVARFMADRGYTNFVLVKRHGEFETLQINDATTRPGDWGNAIFIQDAVFSRLSSALFAEVAAAQQRLIDKAQFFADEAAKRLDLIEQDRAAVAAAHDAQEQLARQVREKQASIVQLTEAAQERLRLIEEANAQAAQARAALERFTEQLLEREHLIADLTATAGERLRLLEASTAEADEMRALVARLNDELAERGRIIDGLSGAAEERLRLIRRLNVDIRTAHDQAQHLAGEIRIRDRLIVHLTEELKEKERVIVELADTARQRLQLIEQHSSGSHQS